MPTTLLQATVGAGKTEAALTYLSQLVTNPEKPFARAWVLLATKRQEVMFRQRLIALQDQRSVYFNAEMFNFYELNARILNLTGQPQRRIKEPARLGLLRKIFYDLRREKQLPTFAPIVHTSGFLRMVADLIDELKQNRVYPETYQSASVTAKDHELSLIYSTYQDLLQRYQLVDREGEGWLALEELESQPMLAHNIDLLLVDGYDQFTPVQASVLATLSQQVTETIITLTGTGANAEERYLGGDRFQQAQQRLASAHQQISAPYRVQLQQATTVTRHPDLVALAQNIFSERPPVSASGAVRLIEAPEPLQEIASIMREVKQLLLDGVRPDDILIALRDWARYHTYITMYMRLYELPLLLHYGEPLLNNPAITVLMNVLSLASGTERNAVTAFRRRELLDVLRSPYVRVPGFTGELVDLLDTISQQKQVLSGYDNWLQAIDQASEMTYDQEDNMPKPPLIDPEQGRELSISLQDFFDAITPQPQDTHLGYVAWLEHLIGTDDPAPDDNPHDSPLFDLPTTLPAEDQGISLKMPECIRAVSGQVDMEHILQRDISALNQFKELLQGMLAIQDFLRATLDDTPMQISWQDFFADIQVGVQHARPLQRNPMRSGRVLVTTATEARGLPHDHIFIPGLSEGIFPAELPEDPIYLDGERQQLREAGVYLQTQAERADDDGIFYELISQARQTLTLSRPHVRDGKHWVESHLWRMVRAVFTDLPITHLGIGEVVPPQQVASLEDAVIALADGLNQSQASDDVLALYQWLTQAHGAHWTHITKGYQAEYRRLSDKPHDADTGYLQHPDLIEIIAHNFGEEYVWSASRLNAYGHCGYRFFAGQILGLEALTELQEGMDVLQTGSVNHAILELTYQRIKEEGFPIAETYQDDAHEILTGSAHDVFVRAPEQYQFRPSPVWEHEQQVILRRLERLIKRDFSADSPFVNYENGDTARHPLALELKFGFDEPLALPIADGRVIRVRGVIDRVDRVGDQLVLVDYKSGTTPIPSKEINDGRNFQMMIYLLALEQQYPHEQVAGGFFWHIRNQQTSGEMFLSDAVQAKAKNDDPAFIAQGQAHIANYLDRIQRGDFSVQPTKPSNNRCTSYCEFYQLCRLANTYPYKRER
ncbi:MAG: PD-(D/E)XK nuclease family protein [Anaerolineae bacterium]